MSTRAKWILCLAGVAVALLPGLPLQARVKHTATERFGESLCNQPGYHCVTADYVMEERETKTRRGVQVRTRKSYPSWESMWPDPDERAIVNGKKGSMDVRAKVRRV